MKNSPSLRPAEALRVRALLLDRAERVTLALGCDVILNRNETQLSAAIYPKYPEPAGLM